MAASRYADLRLYGRLLRQSRPYWLYILVLFLLSLLSTPLALLTPLPLKIVVDSVVGSQPMPRPLELILSAVATNTSTSRLVLAAVLVIAIPLLNEFLGAGGSLLRTYTGEKLVMDFRTHLFATCSGSHSRITIQKAHRIPFTVFNMTPQLLCTSSLMVSVHSSPRFLHWRG